MKFNKKWLLIGTIGISGIAFASANRILDGQQITNGAATLSLPSSTDTLVGRASTDTLTNKTLTSPVINSPTGIVKGDVGLGNVDNTSDATKNSASVTLTNKTISGASNTISNIAAGSSLTGQVPVANGGTGSASLTAGSVVVGNGTSAVSLVAPGSSGNVLTSNGSTWTSAAPASGAPSLNGGSASPQSVTAAGGVSLASISYSNFAWVVGSPGAVTVTATPSITAGSADGQILRVVGTHATNTVRLQDKANLASSGLSLNGDWIGGLDSVLVLHWDAANSLWVEDSRR